MFTHQRTLRLGDTDAAGVVYFASLLSICHETYEAFLDDHHLSLSQLLEAGQWGLPIVHAEIDFWRPLGCGDRLSIQLHLHNLSRQSFSTRYQLSQQDNPDLWVAQAQLDHVCVVRSLGRKGDLPPEWFAVLQAWADD
jgi:1,4-dihydroxy-2-naphthoyl-CoA hydrolase